MKIVAISDVHTKWGNLVIPPCDILISAGDYSFHGQPDIVRGFHRWLNEQEANHIISVQGNHETWVEKNFEKAKEIALQECPAVHFMDEGLVQIEDINIWCSAVQPWFHNWAWNRERGLDIQKHWNLIPNNTDIVVTHGPVKHILDAVYFSDGVTIKEYVGCEDLYNKIMSIPSITHHICGHVHGGHGYKYFNGKHFYNASICDENYMPTNPVTVIDYDKE